MADDGQVTTLPRTQDMLFWFVSLLPVIGLLICDLWKAWKRRAIWIPGDALLLSSIIIHVLSFIDYSHLSLASPQNEARFDLKKNEVVIDSGRLMMCVLIAYLLPGIARSGSVTQWWDLYILVMTIIYSYYNFLSNFFSFRRHVNQSPSPSPSSPSSSPSPSGWDIAYNYVLCWSIATLGVMMNLAVFMGSGIRNLMSQKISLALSCCCNPPEMQTYDNIEVHVRKCWIVVRASRPNHVIARSTFSSMAGAIVTYCVVLSVIKWTYSKPAGNESETKLVKLVIVGQLAIVLIGWIAVVIRWLASALYYSSRIHFDYIEILARSDLLWDFGEGIAGLVENKRSHEETIRNRLRQQEGLIGDIRQSRQYRFLLVVMKMSRCLRRPLEIILVYTFKMFFEIPSRATDQFSKYKEALEIILLPGEKAEQVYISNKWAFDQLNALLREAREQVKAVSVELITLLKHKTEAAEDETNTSLEAAKCSEQVGKTCWKNRVVLLIRAIIYCFDGQSDVVPSAVEAYKQVWEYMEFCESSETKVNLPGREADKEFNDIADVWDEMKSAANQGEKETAQEKIKKPLRDEMEKLSHSMNETEATTERERNPYLYNLQERENCLKVVANTINGPNAMAKLEHLLAKVLRHCMEKELKRAIVEKCNEWAEQRREQHIFDAAFITAKAKALLDEVYKADRVHEVLDEVLIHEGVPTGLEGVGLRGSAGM